MSRKVADRDTYLAEKEADLTKEIADKEREARQLRSELTTVTKERQDRERYALGTLVHKAGLDAARLKALLAAALGQGEA